MKLKESMHTKALHSNRTNIVQSKQHCPKPNFARVAFPSCRKAHGGTKHICSETFLALFNNPSMSDSTISGWWFGTFYIFPYVGNVIIPTDFHIFQRGRSTANQFAMSRLPCTMIQRPVPFRKGTLSESVLITTFLPMVLIPNGSKRWWLQSSSVSYMYRCVYVCVCNYMYNAYINIYIYTIPSSRHYHSSPIFVRGVAAECFAEVLSVRAGE
jgi:hypothetical protein